MKTTKEKIAVMQYFENGGKIQSTILGKNNWTDCEYSTWNWRLFDYRIKEEPKEYEIQTVIQPHVESKYTLYKNVQFGCCYNGDVYCCNGGQIRGFDMMENISKYNWKINSVKRLSDGEIFTIGDKVKQSNVIHDNSFTITGFKLDVNNKHLLVLGNGGIRLSKIEKVKEQLFITQDGAKLYQGDEYYQITPNYEIHKCTAFAKSNFDNNIIVFFNKSNAENHVLMNKTCLSIREICPVIGQCNNNTHIDLDKLTEKLKKLVESK